MAGLVPAIHVSETPPSGRRGRPSRAGHDEAVASWEKPVRLSLIICGKPELGAVDQW
jgi:hypothetical protein